MVATSKVPARGCARCVIAALAVLIPAALSGQSPRAAVLVSVRAEAKRAFVAGNVDEARALLDGRASADTVPGSLRSAQARLFQLHAVIEASGPQVEEDRLHTGETWAAWSIAFDPVLLEHWRTYVRIRLRREGFGLFYSSLLDRERAGYDGEVILSDGRHRARRAVGQLSAVRAGGRRRQLHGPCANRPLSGRRARHGRGHQRVEATTAEPCPAG